MVDRLNHGKTMRLHKAMTHTPRDVGASRYLLLLVLLLVLLLPSDPCAVHNHNHGQLTTVECWPGSFMCTQRRRGHGFGDSLWRQLAGFHIPATLAVAFALADPCPHGLGAPSSNVPPCRIYFCIHKSPHPYLSALSLRGPFFAPSSVSLFP